MTYLREIAEQRSCSLFEALKFAVDDDLLKGTKARQVIDSTRNITTYEHVAPRAGKSSRGEAATNLMLRTEGSQRDWTTSPN